MLAPYGCDWTKTPNFSRLAEHTARFNRNYVGSMPCMPARRELHTGRPNFLHANWSPMDPYDESVILNLRGAGVQTHLCTDHYHYLEEAAANYHTRFDTWEMLRGQEGDPFVGQVDEPYIPEHENRKGRRQDWVNREHITEAHQWPIAQTFKAGLEHIRRNADADRWFLQLECFDPHEPWHVPDQYVELFPELRDYKGKLFDWPGYESVDPERDPPEKVRAARLKYAALLAMCDEYLGQLLDTMDELNLWEETMLVVWTDHGFLLGEHDWWAKNSPPWYEELSHTPLFIWDPRSPASAGTERDSFTQTIDMAPTIAGFFDAEPLEYATGVDLAETIRDDTPGRAAGIFGGWGHYVNVTDGRYVYMRAPVREDGLPLYQYALSTLRLKPTTPYELVDSWPFMKGMKVLKQSLGGRGGTAYQIGHLLFDLENDPHQQHPITDQPELESRMIALLIEQMQLVDAPHEQYERLGLKN